MMSAESTSLFGLRIYLAVSDAIAGFFIDLIEADFLSLAARGKQGDRTRYKREFQVAFPIRTRGHDTYSMQTGDAAYMEASIFRV
jgi:hypothetical protein